MASIFTLENTENLTEKIDIDELYERKKAHDLRELQLFQKILNRIYVKIRHTSKMKTDEQFVWFLVPEIIIGYPKYDITNCILFLIDKLQKSNFKTKYYHPNLLFICWSHYVPAYVRDEIKNKTGIKINEFGEKIETEQPDKYLLGFDGGSGISGNVGVVRKKTDKDKYNNTKSYQPTGFLSLSKLQNKNQNQKYN